jgi:hypothetical protein
VIGVGSHRHANHDAKRTTATATQRPEEIRMLTCVGNDEFALLRINIALADREEGDIQWQ